MTFKKILYYWDFNLYSRFLIFAFCICYQFCTIKNSIFSTQFYLWVWLLACLLSSPFNSPFSSPGRVYLFHPPSLLYTTPWISACCGLWRILRELITGWICLYPSDSPFSPPGHLCPSSLLCVTPWTSLRGPDWG